jgi:DDE superfamily endonuclease
MSPAMAWAALLAAFAAVFTAPSAAIFADLADGWVLAPGRRTVTRMIAAADPDGRRAHDAYHRFLRVGRWSMTHLWQTMATIAVATLCPDGDVVLDVDDTLFHRSGRRVEGAGWFRDAVRSGGGRVIHGFGLNIVVVTLRIVPPWGGAPLGLPINARLHRRGGPTQPDHARQMLTEIAGWFPQRSLAVCADGAYSKLLAPGLPPMKVCVRMRSDAALFEPPPPPTGRPGRPRTRGAKLPTPAHLAAGVRRWQTAAIDLGHRRITRQIWSRTVIWYRVNHTDPLRLIIVRDPTGKEPDMYLVSNDLDTEPAAIVARYAGRWSIEVTFRNTKQELRGEDPQCWKHHGPERAAALSLWLSTAIWVWYIPIYHSTPTWRSRPWYSAKRTPSFHDALAALRRALWEQRITPLSSRRDETAKTTRILIDLLADTA